MNQDIAALAKKTLEYTLLSRAQVQERKWEIMLFIGTIYMSATEKGVELSKQDMQKRFQKELAAAGGDLALVDPYWHVRVDDGRPPALQHALESALDNPARTLSARLAVLRAVAPEERAALTDLVRALSADAFAGATGAAKTQYVDAMRAVSKTWFKDPWLIILPRGDGADARGPAIQILLDDQGVGANDGSILDKNPDDDPLWSKAIREWDVSFLRDNPLAQIFTTVTDVAAAGDDLLQSGLSAAKALAMFVRWAPWVIGGMAVAGVATVATVAVVRAVR